MVQGFYSLEEAANVLGVAPDELTRMAEAREIRAFSESGTFRFRTQDVDDFARQRSGGDDLLPLSDDPPPAPRKTAKPKSQVKSSSALDDDLIPVDDDIFGADLDAIGSGSASGGGFDDDEDVLLGGEVGSGSRPPSGVGEQLVKERASFEFDLTSDSDVRLADDSATKKKTKSKPPSSGRLAPVPNKPGGDSDVRLDFEGSTAEDSLIGAGDKTGSGRRLDEPLDLLDDPGATHTEEIDLDAELQQADDSSMKRRANKTKAFPPPKPGVPNKTKATPQAKGTMLPDASPFELSEDDLDAGSSDLGGPLDSGSDSVDRPMGSEFELTLAPEESPLNLGEDEDVDLGELSSAGPGGSGARAELSGINLHDPADSGISLEEDEDIDDSVSFELTLDGESDTGPKTIKGKLPPAEDSDSEFELTLDEGAMSSSPSLRGSGSSGTAEEKDIFETDFDLPALDDESASQAVALDEEDTDLESSDFDLAVESGVNLDKSGSGVVALEEEGADPDISSVDEMLIEEEEEAAYEDLDEEDEETSPALSIPAAEAEWGLFPIIMLIPCVVLMFLSGLMAYELMRGNNGYQASSKPGGVVVRFISGIGGDELKD